MIIEDAATFVEDYYIQLVNGYKSTIEISLELNVASKAVKTIDLV